MKFFKKSLGQNFLIDKNIIKKIINLVKINNKNIIEIGPGKGALTDEILKKNPKMLKIIEKDTKLAKDLELKYSQNKNVRVLNEDILKFKIETILDKNYTIFGNLPYNISSQILIKILKLKKLPSKVEDVIFMFQKELGEKIACKYPSKNYGRLSIFTYYKLDIINKFLVSLNCFFPRPKVTSMIIHFKPKKSLYYNIADLKNLEKVTNILFSNKRKMINKSIKKLLNKNQIAKLLDLKLDLRPNQIKPEMYYKITEIYEKS